MSFSVSLVNSGHLLVSFGVLLVNSGHLLVSFGVLLVNSGHLLVSFGVLLVNSGHLLVSTIFSTIKKEAPLWHFFFKIKAIPMRPSSSGPLLALLHGLH
ncbi:hypothetical protein ACFX4I_16495 [Peribacillus sp. YIM B13472]|uniref:hypothetical protein n=1 Tax=Peribacillus sp. YIM B13472 TaxID=3366297 RepID=UPI00366D2A6E